MEQKPQLIFEIEPLDENQITNLNQITSYSAESDDPAVEKILKVRLDKWLWAARFFKTRPLARAAIEHGKVYYDGQKTIPSKEIELGATVTINQGRINKAIVIRGLSTRRRNLDEAEALYEELAGIYTEDVESVTGQNYPHPSSQPRKPIRYLRRSMGVVEPEK